MKIFLKTPFFYAGHRYGSGDVVDLPSGTDGPYINGTAAFDVIDEEAWNERQALNAKHAKELHELETPERKRHDLVKKQSEESAQLRRKHADKELVRKHEREKADLEAQHKAQAEALKNREPAHVVPPRETNEAQLGERHKAEAADLAKRQEAEKKALVEEHKVADEREKAADKNQDAPTSRSVSAPEVGVQSNPAGIETVWGHDAAGQTPAAQPLPNREPIAGIAGTGLPQADPRRNPAPQPPDRPTPYSPEPQTG